MQNPEEKSKCSSGASRILCGSITVPASLVEMSVRRPLYVHVSVSGIGLLSAGSHLWDERFCGCVYLVSACYFDLFVLCSREVGAFGHISYNGM